MEPYDVMRNIRQALVTHCPLNPCLLGRMAHCDVVSDIRQALPPPATALTIATIDSAPSTPPALLPPRGMDHHRSPAA